MKSLLTKRWLHMLLLLLLLIGAIALRQQDSRPVQAMRYLAFDTFNRFHPREPTDQVVIVDIDEASLNDAKQGQWPWPRTTMAQLVTNLKEMGAKVVIFDVVFSEVDRTSPSVLIPNLPKNLVTVKQTEQQATLPDHDVIFAEAIRKAGNVVTGFVSSKGQHDKPLIISAPQVKKGAKNFKENVPKTRGIVPSLPMLEKAAAGNGYFGVESSVDGIIRNPPLFARLLRDHISLYPSLSVEALRVAQSTKAPAFIDAAAKGKGEFFSTDIFSSQYLLSIGEYRIPLNEDGLFYVHYSEERSDKYIPAWTIIEKTANPASVKDKIVLVGTSAAGLKDLRSTPIDYFIPGVEVHLNIIEQILQGRFLQRLPVIQSVEILLTFMAGILIVILGSFINPVFIAVLTLSLIGSMGALSLWAYDVKGFLVDPVYPSVTIFLLSILATFLTYLRTEAERRAVRQAFGLYISPDYMKELTSNPDQLRLGGELRDITVMFTDIRGFTTISEQLKPDELIHLMNDFLTPMSDLVMSNRGTIDKYMGDAMMAFWNAPLTDEEHARNACITALSMNEALKPINERIIAEAEAAGKTPLLLKAGIGVNSGPGAVGNMGSKQRFAYSAMGDTVNLASRLEGQTKGYGVDVLIGEATAAAVPDFALLELDLIQVKGKQVPVRIFTLLGNREEAQKPEFHVLQLAHKKMLGLYREREFKAALEALQDCLDHAPSSIHGYYGMMRERITEMQKTPPDESWDGVFVAQSK